MFASSCAPASKIIKLSQRDHVLMRPGMYIGSIENDVVTSWAPVSKDGTTVIERSELEVNNGLLKIFQEVLNNSSDHAIRTAASATPLKAIKVTICPPGTAGEISVWNDGDGIDVSFQPEHDLRGPQLLFGSMLCGTNFDPSEERTVIGQNGAGVKATNIFSSEFRIETVDAVAKKLYTQRWHGNMGTVEPPVLKACAKKPYTQVTFTPDYERIGCNGLSEDMHALFLKNVYDLCAITPPDVSVYLNGEKLKFKNLEMYAELYLGPKSSDRPRVYAKLNDRWEILAACSSTENVPEHVSFVNGAEVRLGGRHIDDVTSKIGRKLAELANKRRGNKPTVKPVFIMNNLFIIVKCTIPSPMFDSQSKNTLVTVPSRFGCRVEIPDTFIDKLAKSGILERADALAASGLNKQVAKTDGNAKKTRVSVAKLDDATLAGTARSNECTLLVVEGDSAKVTAVAGLAVVGREKFGIYPVRGKPMNVRDATASKIAANAEITDLKKILGLETGKTYTSTSELRYGKVCCLTDADLDGSHIVGLLTNAFASLWPSLFKIDGFLSIFMTPIIKATKGKEVHQFFNQRDFEEWMKQGHKGYSVKYYKGLGGSNSAEAKDYFREFRTKRLVYDERSDDKLSLAFCNKRADDRKAWLETYDHDRVLEVPPTQAGGGQGAPVTHAEFVDLELIHFSDASVQRAIPSAIDGLKPSHRKVIYACFKQGLTKGELRVAQLSGIVSSIASYHHGEASLQGAIVNLAQDFVGSNNVNLLLPLGQFGSRLMGGSDSASPRYIHTRLSPQASLLFRQEDMAILKYIVEEGTQIEPRYYIPVAPLVLMNGALGIGTGFSTSIPCFRPQDVIANVRRLIAGEEPFPMSPWYRGFTGELAQIDGKYWSLGRFERKGATVLDILELPVGTWTENAKEHFESLVGQHGLKSVDNQCTDTTVRFSLKFSSGSDVDNLLLPVDDKTGLSKVYSVLKLASQKGLSVTNIHLYGARSAIRKYPSADAILREHFDVRLDAYTRRKAHLEADLEAALKVLNAKARFVREVISQDIKLLGIKNADLDALLDAREYERVDDSFGYLTRMPMSSLTAEKASALEDDAKCKGLELAELRATSERAMWLKELDELEKAL